MGAHPDRPRCSTIRSLTDGIVATGLFVLAVTGGILWLPWSNRWKAIVFNLMAFAAFLLIPYLVIITLFMPLIGEVKSVGTPR